MSHRFTQHAECAHGRGKILTLVSRARLASRPVSPRLGKRFLIPGVRNSAGSTEDCDRGALLLLGSQNVGGALGAGQQVPAVLGIEERAQRFDTADDHQEVVVGVDGRCPA